MPRKGRETITQKREEETEVNWSTQGCWEDQGRETEGTGAWLGEWSVGKISTPTCFFVHVTLYSAQPARLYVVALAKLYHHNPQ